MYDKRAVVICHGAYFLPEFYKSLSDELEESGFLVHCPRLPTCGDTEPASKTEEDDRAVVKHELRELTEEGYDIVLLMHSYGGVVGTNAASDDLIKMDGKTSGIVSLVYLTAYVMAPGQSIVSAHQSHPDVTTMLKASPKSGSGLHVLENPVDSLLNDLETSQADYWARRLTTHNAIPCATAKIVQTPYTKLPTVYVFCERDQAIMPQMQGYIVEDLQKQGLGEFRTESCPAAHSPHLSMPTQIVGLVKKAWDSSINRE